VQPSGMWHVCLSVGGNAHDPADVLAALERLSQERPFLMSGRYDGERAEVRYWEEAQECGDACALALRLWGEHRQTAGLPAWQVVGVSVLGRDEYVRREDSVLAPAGGWRPF
jgi:hypothetical protein